MYTRTYRLGRRLKLGELKVPYPDPPPDHEIDGYGLDKKDQYWRRKGVPNWYWARYEANIQDPLGDEKLAEYISEQHHILRNGYWFFNNGEPTYITGTHWFYLNWWHLNSKSFPDFRDVDQEDFLVWDMVVMDPKCIGLLFLKKRREGGTTRAVVKQYVMTITMKGAMGGIQSKTEEDASSLFQQKLITAWQKLPPHFRPIHSGTTKPKKELDFSYPGEGVTAKKLREGRMLHVLEEEALNSKIVFKSSGKLAFDGERLVSYIGDEWGKTHHKIDIEARHDVVRECFMDGTKIIGKAIYPSTIESISDGENINQARNFWNSADPNALDDNGMTESGLYRFFIPGDRGLKGDSEDGSVSFIDKYGRSNKAAARKWILNRREFLRKRRRWSKLTAFIRKYPLSPEEAFTPESHQCSFNVARLVDRINDLTAMEMKGEAPWVRGRLQWVNGEFSSVKWVPDPDGDFYLAQPPDEENKIHIDKQLNGEVLYIPDNNLRYGGSSDPFKFGQVVDPYAASKGATSIWRRPWPDKGYEVPKLVMIYAGRPATNLDFYKKSIMMYWWYGCSAVIEKNAEGMRNWMVDNGFRPMIKNKLDIAKSKIKTKLAGLAGEYTTRPTLILITEALEAYIEYFVEEVDFIPVLQDWMRWNVDNSTKCDITMSTGLGYLGITNKQIGEKTNSRERTGRLASLVPRYRGGVRPRARV